MRKPGSIISNNFPMPRQEGFWNNSSLVCHAALAPLEFGLTHDYAQARSKYQQDACFELTLFETETPRRLQAHKLVSSDCSRAYLPLLADAS